MNRKLLLALAVVGGLSAYLNTSSDDELLAPAKSGQRRAASTGSAQGASPASSPSAKADGRAQAVAPWVAAALTQGVGQWLARGSTSAQGRAATTPSPAWAGVLPPPPPPARVVPVMEAPPPMAPRFPHAWVGRFNDESVNRAVLTGSQSTWVVRAGDVLEGQWRVDAIQERRMTLTYLPLNQQQTVGMK